MSMVSVCWLLTGLSIGFIAAGLIIFIAISCIDQKLSNEEFVKKLIEKKNWTEARWELETLYRGRYMRIWRKLYRKHIEKGENKNEQ